MRVVTLRNGLVLGPGGGALAKMLPPFRAFARRPAREPGRSGCPGSTSEDLVDLYVFAAENAAVRGPVNATAPNPVTMRDFATALGRALHRPSFARVPAAVLELALGEMATVVLDGQRVVPKKAVPRASRSASPDVLAALKDVVGRLSGCSSAAASRAPTDPRRSRDGRATSTTSTRPGTLFGATLRSEVARGRLRGIEKDPSFDWTGVTVVTAEDVPVNVVALIEEDQPVLASGDVRHAYEPLALVAGEDPLRARSAPSST